MDLNNIFHAIISIILKVLTTESFIAPIIAASFGAGIAGFFSFLAIKRAHQYNMAKSDYEERRTTANTLALIMIEIKTAWEVYNEEYAKDLKKLADGQPYIVTFPVGINTFTLYDSSPSCLANLPIETAEKIVLIYMRMKGMIAMIELNNNDVRQAHHAAENSLQLLLSGMAANGRQLDPEKLDTIYNNHVTHEAKKLSMGATADGMKLLNDDIENLYTSLLDITSKHT